MTTSDRARATDEHVKPLLEKALVDMRSKTERLRQKRMAQTFADRTKNEPSEKPSES